MAALEETQTDPERCKSYASELTGYRVWCVFQIAHIGPHAGHTSTGRKVWWSSLKAANAKGRILAETKPGTLQSLILEALGDDGRSLKAGEIVTAVAAQVPKIKYGSVYAALSRLVAEKKVERLLRGHYVKIRPVDEWTHEGQIT